MGVKKGSIPVQKSMEVPQNIKKKKEVAYDSTIAISGYLSQRTEIPIPGNINTLVFIIAVFQYPRNGNKLNTHKQMCG